MKYRLKDQELQKKLDELTDGYFTKKLNSELNRVCFGDQPDFAANRFSAICRADEVEEILEYDPTKWNQYPSVTPPEDVWMRVETYGPYEGLKAQFHAGKWICGLGLVNGQVKRFRPWED